jgi:precorrin-2/cobalt-factor-2 C20-methyltransferase
MNATPPRLVGIGVGPGDPELATVRAVRLLREADTIVVPVMDGGGTGRAEAVVRAYVEAARIVPAAFALDERDGLTARREHAWDAAGRLVRAAFERGDAVVAFATIGDPNVYSTFGYLAQTVRRLVPDVVVETVPGITAMQELAARSGTILCEGREPLTLLPMTSGIEPFEAALDGPGTVVAYKGWRLHERMLQALERRGRLASAVVGSRLGLAGERIGPASCSTRDGPLPYLSTLLVPARREIRGGKL